MSANKNDRSTKIESLEQMILMSAVTGTDCNDVLEADQNGQTAEGLGGNDMILGSGGDNTLWGGDGNDTFQTAFGCNIIDGGDGNDEIVYSGNRSDFTVTILDDGTVQIESKDGSLVDRITNVENFRFDDGTFNACELVDGGNGGGNGGGGNGGGGNGGGGGNNTPEFTNINDDQVISVPEGTINVLDIDASDADGDTLTFSFSDGVNTPGDGPNQDPGLFNLDSATGELTFKVAPDFENPADADGDNEYRVTIVVSDGQSAVERDIIIRVTNVSEGVSTLTNVAENTTDVGDLGGPDGTMSLSGDDADLFQINADGTVSFKSAPDFENPGDADGDNDYVFTKTTLRDGGEEYVNQVTVRVTDVNEGGGNNDPDFSNVNDGQIVNVAENTTSVIDADATDADGDTLTYSISGGADAALFSIDSATGVVTFNNAPDFENPGDADTDNDYQITLHVSDGTNVDEESITVRVTDVNEGGGGNNAPDFTNVTDNQVVSVAENQTGALDADASDADGDTLTYSISGGADASLFSIDSSTGVVTFNAAPDFENPGDADNDNDYQITLQVSDGTDTATRNVTVRVTDVNEGGGGNNAPNFTNIVQGSTIFTVENTTDVVDADGQDPDGDTLTFSIVGGVDAGLFTIDATTGQLSFVNAPDFENPQDSGADNDHQVTIRVSDGTLFADRNITVRVTDAAENGATNTAPFFTNVSQNEFIWFIENNVFVGDANASDAEGNNLTFSIVGGADASFFSINAQTGVVNFINAPDFESALDSNNDNIYELILRVSDGTLFQDRTVFVTVEDDPNA